MQIFIYNSIIAFFQKLMYITNWNYTNVDSTLILEINVFFNNMENEK